MSFTLENHTADVAVEASGDALGEAFAAAADGMAAAQCDEFPDVGDRFDVEERAESPEALLFEFLDRLIYERDVRGVLPTEHEASVEETDGEWVVQASTRGIPLTEVRAREIKAVTYSQMRIEERPDGWHVYVVLDV